MEFIFNCMLLCQPFLQCSLVQDAIHYQSNNSILLLFSCSHVLLQTADLLRVLVPMCFFRQQISGFPVPMCFLWQQSSYMCFFRQQISYMFLFPCASSGSRFPMCSCSHVLRVSVLVSSIDNEMLTKAGASAIQINPTMHFTCSNPCVYIPHHYNFLICPNFLIPEYYILNFRYHYFLSNVMIFLAHLFFSPAHCYDLFSPNVKTFRPLLWSLFRWVGCRWGLEEQIKMSLK